MRRKHAEETQNKTQRDTYQTKIKMYLSNVQTYKSELTGCELQDTFNTFLTKYY